MRKLPNGKDLVNAHLYVELQKKGLEHTKILSKIAEVNGAYSSDLADHVSAVKADHDEFIQNKYSSDYADHNIHEFQKDVGKIPALKKFDKYYESIVHSLDDGSFEVLLFQREKDWHKMEPNKVVKLDPMLEPIAASVVAQEAVVADLKKLPYMSLSKAMFGLSDGLNLSDEELKECDRIVADTFIELSKVEAVHPSQKGQKEPKLQKIKPDDLDKLAEISGSGITKHAIRNAEVSGLDPAIVAAVEKALVAASNRAFQKWVSKRGEESGVNWGKLSESHAEFANYVTSNHMSESADNLLSRLLDMDLTDTSDEKRAYDISLDFFHNDIINFIRQSGPSKYSEEVSKWHEELWGEKVPEEENEFEETAADVVQSDQEVSFEEYVQLCCEEDGKEVDDLTDKDLFYLEDEYKSLPSKELEFVKENLSESCFEK